MPDLGVLVRQLQGLIAGLGGAAAAGSGTLNYNASSVSDPVTVAHGLGVAPSKILLTQQYDGDGRHASIGYFNVTNSTFDVEARDWAGAGVTKVTTFSWVAIA